MRLVDRVLSRIWSRLWKAGRMTYIWPPPVKSEIVSGPTFSVFPQDGVNVDGAGSLWRGYAFDVSFRDWVQETRSAPNTYRRSRNSRRRTSSVPAARICRRRLSQTRRSEPQLRRQVSNGGTLRAEPRNRSNHTHVCQRAGPGCMVNQIGGLAHSGRHQQGRIPTEHGGIRRSSRRGDPPGKASGA